MKILFNKPNQTGDEIKFISQLINENLHISGNGAFTKKCQFFFEEKYHFQKTLLTSSCTAALEMCAILADIKKHDEVIIPSFTFVSTANAFVLRGAKIVFADSKEDHPNIDEDKIEALITKKTKAIVVVHYAGVACDMDKIMAIATKYNLLVIEDAAHAIDSFYHQKPLGGIGHLSTFSFHETKNIQCGTGGLLIINDPQFYKRSEIISENGTNRLDFLRGDVKKYEWMDIGSSFLASELNAAYLHAQLKSIRKIQSRRIKIWNQYYHAFQILEKTGKLKLPLIPSYAANNGHTFYIICNSTTERNRLIQFLKKHNIQAVFHYLSLHKSSYYKEKHDGRVLANSDNFENKLIRLPLYIGLTEKEIECIISAVMEFFNYKC